MSQPSDLESLPKEERVKVALEAIKKPQGLSLRRAAVVYKVSKTTLCRRRVGTKSTRDTHPKSANLPKTEQRALVQYIRNLDAQGFAPTLRCVEDMANQLRAARDAKPVGPRWASHFVKREPELKSRMTWQRDRQRDLCSDPTVIRPWFDLVQNVKAKYSIQDEDTYNFDETGFTIGVGNRVKVVTASERRTEPIGLQQGDREWVTSSLQSSRWAGQSRPTSSLKQRTMTRPGTPILRPQWRIGVSDNGWTTNEIGVAWLKHFIEQIKGRRVGSHVLLLIDGHESHKSLTFQDLCEENKIITLCMPPHLITHPTAA